MTACTVHVQAENRLPRRRHDVIKLIKASLLRIDRLIVPLTKAVIPGRNQAICASIRHFIPGQLLFHKAIVWFVIVEGLDHVVAVAPNIGLIAIPFK